MLNETNVFVYGTLKPGEVNYSYYCAGKVLAVKEAIAFGKLYALPLGYPAMTKGESPVQGFLLSFPDWAILNELDFLEGFNPLAPADQNEYYRQIIETYSLSLLSLGSAWVYLMTPERVNSLDGVFLDHGWWSGCGRYPGAEI